MQDSFNKSPSKRSNHVSKSRNALCEKKAKKIEDLLDYFNSDLSTSYLKNFQEFAMNEGGLVNDKFRLEIWPLLAETMPIASHLDDDLSAPDENDLRTSFDSEIFDSTHSSSSFDEFDDDYFQNPTSIPVNVSLEELRLHPEWGQVELDVHRTLARFPPNISVPERRQLQGDLTPMIVELLHSDASFHYYQGFHDVCLTLILILGVEHARTVGRHLVTKSSLRNYLTKSFEESALRELHLIYVILHKCDPELERRLRLAGLGTFFALSWVITWFSHSLRTLKQVALCFDLFLASGSLMPIYVSAAMIEHRRKEIFAVEAEMSVLHDLLNHIPESIDIEAVLKRARKLYSEYKPRKVQGKLLVKYEKLCTLEGNGHIVSSTFFLPSMLTRNCRKIKRALTRKCRKFKNKLKLIL